MKYFSIPLLAGMLLCHALFAQKKEFSERVSKEFSLTQGTGATTLSVFNISGPIHVEGYSGKTVVFEIEKTITAKTDAALNQGKKEFQLGFDQQADSVTAFIAAPFDSRPRKNNNRDLHIEYEFRLDFKVKVPFDMNVHVSTVNDGEVTVTDVRGALHTFNVNGAITMTNVRGDVRSNTVNGDIIANYVALPPGGSDFKTLNGNIRITYPAGLSADCSFKTFNGDFYTDFPTAASVPVKVVKNTENSAAQTTFKLSADTMIRIGRGGPTLKFETFNGSIYIKKQS